MEVILQIIIDLLTVYGVNPSLINGLAMIVYIAYFISLVYTIVMAPFKVIAMYKGCKDFFANLKLQCKKPPKSVGAEVDGSNNSLN